MILHYLKVATRSLMKYKMQSLISALCLAAGIVCFSYTYQFVETVAPTDHRPHYDRRLNLSLVNNRAFSSNEITRMEEELRHAGVEAVTAYSKGLHTREVVFFDQEGQERPFLVRYRNADAYYYTYNGIPVTGITNEFGPTDVVLSEAFARKAFGNTNPVGMILRIVNDQSGQLFKVAGVATGKDPNTVPDCYFPVTKPSDNHILYASCYRPEKMDLNSFRSLLEKIAWTDSQGKPIKFQVESESSQHRQTLLAKLLFLLVVSLILVSGLINFLKFTIQMFFNRQRELALRKCLGSDTKGLYGLLASEVILMMTAALLLSFLLTEWTFGLAYSLLPMDEVPDIRLQDVYLTQLKVYLVVVAVCLLIISFPLRKLRQISLYAFLQQSRKRHTFRNAMIGLQLVISMFFAGGVALTWLASNELLFDKMYNPLPEGEQERIVVLPLKTQYLENNIQPILTEVRKMPEVEDVISYCISNPINFHVYTEYERKDKSVAHIVMSSGSPRYFRFFHIPMQGKVVPDDASGEVYVSEAFKQLLDADGNTGTVRLDNRDYRIAGVYKALFNEVEAPQYMGSVFMPSTDAQLYYIKVTEATDLPVFLKRLDGLCREFVPSTLPIDLMMLNESDEGLNIIKTMRVAMSVLAVVSLLLVVLSIFSAISMDTVARLKEVAIRKINGATPRNIAWMFGKVYILLFAFTFLLVYPLLFLSMKTLLESYTIDCIYRWEWPLLMFISVGCLVVVTLGMKIWQVMKLNPAEVIKRE